MVAYVTVPKFRDFLGVDLKSTDIKRGRQFASGGQNVDFTTNNSINKRRGYQHRAVTGYNAGLVEYSKVDTLGVPDPELISIGDTLRKLVTSTLDVSYSGAVEGRVEFILQSTTSTFVFRAIEDNVEKLSYDCGDGLNTVVPISDLIAAIGTVSNFSASTTGDDTQPAAFLEIKREQIVEAGTPLEMSFEYFTDINSGNVTMAGNTSNQGTATYENASFVNLNNVLYITNATDGLFKYDAQTFYKAGMPRGSISSAAVGAAGSLTGSYVYGATYLQIDNQGQVVEGNISEDSSTVVPAAQVIDVTLNNILSASGFNTNAGIVAGAQVTVNTLTLDDGSGGSHTFKQGDTAFFFDSVSGDYITRSITAVAGTTITIDGAAVTVADNAVISNNLRIAIYRTVDSGVTKFLVAEIPNDPFTATQVYSDDLADASLGATYITPRFGHDEPPKCQYITTYRNLLILAGSSSDPSRFYWSDLDGPEFFPTSSHAGDVNTKIGDTIRGLGVNNDQLCVFKDQSIFVGAGDFGNLNFVVDQLTSGDLGCVSHASIQEVREGVLYFLTSRGPYQIVGGQLPSPVGPTVSDSGQVFSRIESFFTDLNQRADFLPRLRRSLAINWPEQAKYVLFVPSEDSTTSSDANENSTVWVFDYSRGAWLPKWTNINGAGGMAVHDSQVYWSSKDSTQDTVSKFLDTYDEYDFADHTTAVDFIYQDSWEHLGEPNIKKKFLRLVMMVLDEIESASWDLTVEMGVEFSKDIVWANLVVPFGDSSSLGWGNSPWGEFAWGEPINISKRLKLKSNKTKALRVSFKNNDLHKNILLTGWEIEVAPTYSELR
jgi:hypothetical protein